MGYATTEQLAVIEASIKELKEIVKKLMNPPSPPPANKIKEQYFVELTKNKKI